MNLLNKWKFIFTNTWKGKKRTALKAFFFFFKFQWKRGFHFFQSVELVTIPSWNNFALRNIPVWHFSFAPGVTVYFLYARKEKTTMKHLSLWNCYNPCKQRKYQFLIYMHVLIKWLRSVQCLAFFARVCPPTALQIIQFLAQWAFSDTNKTRYQTYS